jgi:hypothetical protein
VGDRPAKPMLLQLLRRRADCRRCCCCCCLFIYVSTCRKLPQHGEGPSRGLMEGGYWSAAAWRCADCC